jgi:hypothetical protein
MIVQSLNSSLTKIKFGNYFIFGNHDLVNGLFSELGILKYNHEIDISPTFLTGKLLTNETDRYHFTSAVIPTKFLGDMCEDALTAKNIEVSIKIYIIYIIHNCHNYSSNSVL